MALEPYFRGDVPDVQICTVNISYERTLEEKLYAYETLGVPKPRESTSVRAYYNKYIFALERSHFLVTTRVFSALLARSEGRITVKSTLTSQILFQFAIILVSGLSQIGTLLRFAFR